MWMYLIPQSVITMAEQNKSTNHPSPSDNSPSISKPVRPLTAYHLFFQLERELIMQTTPKASSNDGNAHENYSDHRQYGYEIDPEMPTRYKFIFLSPFWYMSASGKRMKTYESEGKRRHKRRSGKISFLELSSLVSTRWATLQQTCPEIKVFVQKIAKRGEFLRIKALL
jgi:hypothetical protein